MCRSNDHILVLPEKYLANFLNILIIKMMMNSDGDSDSD